MKVLFGVVIGAVIVFAAWFFMNQPEPTPQEKLGEAVEQAGDAAKDAMDAVKDATSEAADSLATDLSKSADDLAVQIQAAGADISQRIGGASDEAKAELTGMLADWKASGIVTDTGIDLDKASEALGASDLTQEAKTQIEALLQYINEAPETFAARLGATEQTLQE